VFSHVKKKQKNIYYFHTLKIFANAGEEMRQKL